MDIRVRNVVLAGVSGWNGNGWLLSADPAAYERQANACVALAEAVANIITIPDSSITGFQLAMLAAICNGVIAGRSFSDANPADYATIAQSIKALWTASSAKLIAI